MTSLYDFDNNMVLEIDAQFDIMEGTIFYAVIDENDNFIAKNIETKETAEIIAETLTSDDLEMVAIGYKTIN